MSRNVILALAAVLWTAFAIDVIVHIAMDNWVSPVGAGVAGVVLVAVWRVRDARPSWR